MALRHWFLPRDADVLGLLREQAAVTLSGIQDFRRWSEGDSRAADATIAAEHGADEVRRHLQVELRAAFSTPLDAEDIYELSERLDTVMNSARDTAREAELMAMAPDAAMAEMAGKVEEGVLHLVAAFDLVHGHADRATREADLARAAARGIEHSYRAAMSALIEVADMREVMGRRELYRRYARLGEAIVSVAERVWYAVVKEA